MLHDINHQGQGSDIGMPLITCDVHCTRALQRLDLVADQAVQYFDANAVHVALGEVKWLAQPQPIREPARHDHHKKAAAAPVKHMHQMICH